MCIQICNYICYIATDRGLSMLSYITIFATFATDRGRVTLSYVTIFATFATDRGLSMLSYITIFATLLHLLLTEVGVCFH